ncbi:ubiquitin-conjugating enzyme E2-binding protein [Trichophaea hybrida]|nr:ubiquitin-conjugating enzyme E2-binding protein [Trichophaea hybrida]
MLDFTFYAELLPNIQSINLLISLSSPTTAFTRTTIDPGSSFATLYHNGESASLILPAPVNPGKWQLVLKPTPGELNLSGRLPLLLSSLPITYITRGNNAPWSARDLSTSTPVSFGCRSCSAVLIPNGQITQWKNLPSSNWVEMMDFWHCHKPFDNTQQKSQGSSQNQSLFEKGLVVDQGIGFVERESFLILVKDCKAVK